MLEKKTIKSIIKNILDVSKENSLYEYMLLYALIGVFRVGQMGATHPPKVSHPFFIFAPRCRGGCRKKLSFYISSSQ